MPFGIEAHSAEKAREITKMTIKLNERKRRYDACEPALIKINSAISNGQMSTHVGTIHADSCRELLLELGYSITKMQGDFSSISWEDNGGSTNNQ